MDISKLRRELGYRDAVQPAEAIARTARWLAEHPPEPRGMEETVLQDPFDYAAEDALIDGWRAALQTLDEQAKKISYELEPGYTLSYSGPGGRARSGKFEE